MTCTPRIPVGTQRTAEHFRLVNGQIASITLIFDATPWQSMAAMMGPDIHTPD